MKPEEITKNVFDMIGKQWMLVSATKDGKTNAMTASWGGLGVMWGKNVAFVFIRESRYTKEFVDASDKMILSFFSEDYRKMLGYMGTVSGRTEDKIEKAGLTLTENNTFEQAKLTMVCKKLFASEMKAEDFVSNEELDKWYKDGDMHTMYVVEIEDVLM
ncbi:MAG: flavin reductase [Lachnospiraceae bacterium]|nr:flavin reductase [Lachnospiraceae bacterium]